MDEHRNRRKATEASYDQSRKVQFRDIVRVLPSVETVKGCVITCSVATSSGVTMVYHCPHMGTWDKS